MKSKPIFQLLLAMLVLSTLVPGQTVLADSCSTEWVPNPPPGHFKTVCEGGGGDPGDPPVCIPGTTTREVVFLPSETVLNA